MSAVLYPTADTAPLSEEAAYGNPITATIQHELAVTGRVHADYDSDDRLESDDVVLPLTESSDAPANAAPPSSSSSRTAPDVSASVPRLRLPPAISPSNSLASDISLESSDSTHYAHDAHVDGRAFLPPNNTANTAPANDPHQAPFDPASPFSPLSYEIRSLLAIAWPVALSILCRIGMSVTDLSMVGHLQANDTEVAYLAASSAALVWMNITSAALYRGFGTALNALCAQAYGARNYHLVGVWLQMALAITTFTAIPLAVLWWYTGEMLSLIGIDDDVCRLASLFARWSCISIWPILAYECLARYYQAQHIVQPALRVNALFLAINVGLNYVLIFGVAGFGGYGYVGSPIATAISRWGLLIVFFVYTVFIRGDHRATWSGWDLSGFTRERLYVLVVTQSLPLMLGICAEEWQLQVIAIFAARLGETQLATHNATLEMFFLLSSIMFGLMAASVVRIGFYLGKGQWKSARRVAFVSFFCAVIVGTISGGTFVAFRNYIGLIFSDDASVHDMTAQICLLVGPCYFLLSLFYHSMSVLDAQARPMLVAISFFLGAWCVSIPTGYVFAFVESYDLMGLWYGMVAGYAVVTTIVTTAAALSDWRYYSIQAVKRAETAIRTKNVADTSEEGRSLRGGEVEVDDGAIVIDDDDEHEYDLDDGRMDAELSGLDDELDDDQSDVDSQYVRWNGTSAVRNVHASSTRRE